MAAAYLAFSSEASGDNFDVKMKAAGRSFKEIKLFSSHAEAYLALANGELGAVNSGRELDSRLMHR